MLLIAHRNVLLLFAFLALVAICCCVPDAEKREGSVPGAAAYSAQMRVEAQGSRRKRALPAAILIPLIVGNVLSVIAGSFANDMIVANTWHKTTFCVRVLYRYRLTSSGWKRCWDYARQSSKKWRRLLKQHHLAGILRIIVRRLRANSEVRFKEALLLIQAEHDKLLMSGDQVVRVHQMLSDAGIVLPAFQQNAGKREPLSPDASSLDKWSQLDGPEKDLFIAYVEIVRMLCKDYEHFFGAVIHPKLLTLHSSVVQMRRIDGKLELEAPQQHLTGLSEFSRKFLAQFVAQLYGESATRTRNILFLNVQFALYARALTKIVAAKADDASSTYNGDRLQQQSAFVECILQIAKEKESQIFWGKPEAEAAESAGKNVQEIAERLQLDKDELQNLEEFMGNLIPFNAVDLIEDRDHKCARIEALIVKMEFASIVRRENDKLGIELTDVWAQEAAEEMTFVRELIGAIERDYLGGGDDSDAFNG